MTSREKQPLNKLIKDVQTIEAVREFVYLKSLITNKNNIGQKIKLRILAANKCYYGLF